MGKDNELIISTFTAITCPFLEYAYSFQALYQMPVSTNCKLSKPLALGAHETNILTPTVKTSVLF